MKKIVLFICLSIGSQQAHAMQSLKNVFSRSLSAGAALLAGSLYAQKQAEQRKNTAPSYTINLMWINKNLQPDQQYVFPSQWRQESNFDTKNLNTVYTWESLNPKTPIHVWYDSKHLPTQAIANTHALIQDHAEKEKGIINTYEYSFKTDTNIELKDVRKLPHVKEHPEVFAEKVPVYLRADLLRMIATVHTLESMEHPYFVYADLDVNPLSKTELLDESTLKDIKEYGIVLAPAGEAGEAFFGIENSFHIMSNHKPNLIKAVRRVIIDLNIERTKMILNGTMNNPANIAQMVYFSYAPMSLYFGHLEGKGKIKKLYTDTVYDEQNDILRFFTQDDPSISTHLFRLFNNDNEPVFFDIPTKKVIRPPISGQYD